MRHIGYSWGIGLFMDSRHRCSALPEMNVPGGGYEGRCRQLQHHHSIGIDSLGTVVIIRLAVGKTARHARHRNFRSRMLRDSAVG